MKLYKIRIKTCNELGYVENLGNGGLRWVKRMTEAMGKVFQAEKEDYEGRHIFFVSYPLFSNNTYFEEEWVEVIPNYNILYHIKKKFKALKEKFKRLLKF